MILPGLALLGIFLLYPLLGLILRSFDPEGLLSYSNPELTGANYEEASSGVANRIILKNTLTIGAVATAISVAIAYPVAAHLSRLSIPWTRVLMLLALIPFWTSIVVRMYSLQLIFKQTDYVFTTTASIIGMVSYLVPYLILIFYGGMAGIDSGYVRAARSLGASPARAFFHVYAPLTRPVVLSGALLVFVIALGFFITPALLGPPSGITVSMLIQQQVNIAQWGVAAAMGVGLLILSLIVYWAFNRLSGIERLAGSGLQARNHSGVGTDLGGRRLRLGLGAFTTLVLAALIAPLVYVVLVSFSDQSYLTFPPEGLSLRWYRELFADPGWAESAVLSLQVALLTALLSTALGLPAALALARGRLAFAGPIRALFMLPLVIPVVLLGASQFDIQTRLGISGTVLGYALGHTVLALPFTVLICSTTFRQLGTFLEDAARSLGASPWAAFRLVTLPLVLPSILASAVFAFITSWDEPVMSLFLRGLTPTLPVRIYDNVRQNVEPTVAALSAIVLAAVLIIGVGVLLVGVARRMRLRQRPLPNSAKWS
jgi:putative spermidine/putrescine transport system permease protein